MNDKIHILKEKVDIRIMLCAVFMLTAWIVSSHFDNEYSPFSTNARIMTSVVFLIVFWIFMFVRCVKKNGQVRTGKLI